MNKLSKRAISILVIAILALSFVLPLVSVSALSKPSIVPPAATCNVGDVLTLEGVAGEVTSGAAVNIFWDIAYGPDAWLLNTTTGNPDGSYDVEIKIPDALNVSHYIWVEDVATGLTNGSLSILVLPKLKPDISRGLPEDEVEITGTGFGDELLVNITMYQENRTKTGWNKTDVVIDYGDNIETNEYGTFVATFDVPSGLAYDAYKFNATDDYGNVAEVNFTVGAAITLTPDEGPEGTVIEVAGRGFNSSKTISSGSILWDGTYYMPIVDDTAIPITNGEFTLEVVAPSWGAGSWKIEVDDGTYQGSANFTITGVCTIEVSPTYGSPGASITVKGYNYTQIAGTEVSLKLTSDPESDLLEVDTDEDGTFVTTFISPAVKFATYKVWANDTIYGLYASDAFKVGIIAFIINPTFGEAGTKVAVTGIGFATLPSPGDFNLTFGEKLYEYPGGVVDEAISEDFYVPNVEPGTYDLTVIDEDENELTVSFTVTESTYVSMDPPLAPNDYNVTIKGYHFADAAGEVDFVVYNSTYELDITVWKNATSDAPVETNSDGNFTGLWNVDDILSLGDYTVNVTGSLDLLVQVPFSVVEARVSVAPRKAQFDRGDSIQFNINNDFKLPDAYIEIYDPSDILYWSTEPFEDDYWMLVEDLYTVPYYRQTAALNPMELQSDAPMGPWLYIFYDSKDDQLMNGTFSVGASTAAQVEERLTEIWASMEDLSTNIDSITDELADDIGGLAGDIADISSEVDDLRGDIVGDLADDIAAAADAADAAADAVSDLADVVGDIADIATDAKSSADDAASAADDAKTAAESSETTAQGLTTLVYGAIAASLVAALAAVVSLMQISKKIA